MSPLPDSTRNLRLEALEARMLLAADLADPFGLTADFDLTMLAVSGTGDFHASFSTNWGNHQLVITGGADSALTIDLDLLPSFITNLKISSVGSVTMTGTDHIDNLILTEIDSVAADGLSVSQGVLASGVGALSLASIEGNAVLYGTDMKLSVNSLSDASQIISFEHSVTLSSESKHVTFIAGTSDQTLNLTYKPAPGVLALSGIPESSVHVVLPSPGTGDNGGTDSGTDSNPDHGTTTPGSTDTPGSADGSGSSDGGSDPLVIVTVPLDERTRAFLDQIDYLLHSPQADADQQLLGLLNQGDSSSFLMSTEVAETHAAPEAFAHDFGPHLAAMPSVPAGPTPSFVAASGVTETVAPQHVLPATIDHSIVSMESQPMGSFVPPPIAASDLVHVDLSWPIPLSSTDTLPAAAARKAAVPGDHEHSVVDGARALGDYVVQRIVAEFSPGQQTLVLLVDPQPSRGISTNKKSSEERFAQVSRILLTDINETIAVV